VNLVLLLALADPFVGTWKLRPDKGKSGFESYVVTVTATASGHKWSYDFVVKGMGQHMKAVILTDRKAGTFKYLDEGGKLVAEGKLVMKSPTEWETEGTLKSRTSLSADGKTMTVVNTAPQPNTLVLDKQQQ